MPLPAAGGILTAAALYEAPTTYVPALTAATTNPTLGTGSTQAGFYYRLGDWIIGEARIRFGSSGAAAGTGLYAISLPITANATFHDIGGGTGIASPIGSGALRDNSSLSASRPCVPYLQTATSARLLTSNGSVDEVTPWGVAWANSDALNIQFMYLRA